MLSSTLAGVSPGGVSGFLASSNNDEAEDIIRKLLENADLKSVVHEIKVISRKTLGPSTIRDVFTALNKEENLAKTEEMRLEITKTLLAEIFTNSCIPNANAARILDCVELDHFTDQSLGKIYAKCRGALEQKSTTSYRWLPFLGRVLSVIQSRNAFKPDDDGDEDSGEAYVEAVVKDLCTINWEDDLVAGICALLKVMNSLINISELI